MAVFRIDWCKCHPRSCLVSYVDRPVSGGMGSRGAEASGAMGTPEQTGAISGGGDALVRRVKLYRPVWAGVQALVLPFIVLYVAILYGWLFHFGFHEYYEPGLLALAGAGLLQVLTCLCCYWSVHVYCFLTCLPVSYWCSFLFFFFVLFILVLFFSISGK